VNGTPEVRTGDFCFDRESLQAYIARLDHRDRALVTRHYEQLAPAMARLQMMFVY
jgi:hypothetical protein